MQLPPYKVTVNSGVESHLTAVLEQLTIVPGETEVNQFRSFFRQSLKLMLRKLSLHTSLETHQKGITQLRCKYDNSAVQQQECSFEPTEKSAAITI